MRAVVKSEAGPGIEVLDMPEPSCGDDEVLVQVEFCGICGSDIATYEWRPHRRRIAEHLPRIVGHEAVGVVVEAGSQIAGLAVGDRVVTEPIIHCGTCGLCRTGRTNVCQHQQILGREVDGAMAPFVALPERICYPVPDSVPSQQAPLLEIFGIGVHAVERLGPVHGLRCAIVGPGGIGLTLTQTLRALGAAEVTVFGTARGRARLERAQDLGADQTHVVEGEDVGVDHARRYDLVFEAAGKPLALRHCAQLAAAGGKVAVMGAYDETLPLAYDKMVRLAEIDLIASRARTYASWQTTLALVRSGALDLSQFHEEVRVLEDAPRAFADLASSAASKVMLACS